MYTFWKIHQGHTPNYEYDLTNFRKTKTCYTSLESLKSLDSKNINIKILEMSFWKGSKKSSQIALPKSGPNIPPPIFGRCFISVQNLRGLVTLVINVPTDAKIKTKH